MEIETTIVTQDQTQPDEQPSRALVVQSSVERLLTSRGRLNLNLPALVTERLPALWDGGRGPLAQAVMAGGLLAIGSVVGRMAAGEQTKALAVVPNQPVVAPPPPTRHTEVVIETSILESKSRWGGRTRQVQIVHQRISISRD